MDDPVLSDGLLVFGSLAVLAAPMALALADMGPGGAGWKVLSFLCCAFAGWSFFFRLKFAHRICGVGAGVGMRNAGPTSALCA